tara:strand:- start:249 stop:704 length:456 start_codon:yes stop_codon:yes gene_type:complete
MRIALFEPDIPQNTGNILRLGACLGVEVDIIEPTGFIFDDKKLKRSSMDYINHINFKRHLDWNTFYNWAKNNNYEIILVTTKSSIKYTEHLYKKNNILLFGKESGGVPKYVHEEIIKTVTIPMVKGLRSINLSSSVAIVVSEACRQLNWVK